MRRSKGFAFFARTGGKTTSKSISGDAMVLERSSQCGGPLTKLHPGLSAAE